jgi:hypothetical protein
LRTDPREISLPNLRWQEEAEPKVEPRSPDSRYLFNKA